MAGLGRGLATPRINTSNTDSSAISGGVSDRRRVACHSERRLQYSAGGRPRVHCYDGRSAGAWTIVGAVPAHLALPITTGIRRCLQLFTKYPTATRRFAAIPM